MDNYKKDLTQEYNKSAEKIIENRINSYNLNQDERTMVWDFVQNRDQIIEKEKRDYNDPSIWKERFDAEVNKIKEQQKPELKYNLGINNIPSDDQIKREAWNSVRIAHLKTIQNAARDTDKKIDQILENAIKEGRVKEQEQGRTQIPNRDNDRA